MATRRQRALAMFADHFWRGGVAVKRFDAIGP
jgi:hypothetical protein